MARQTVQGPVAASDEVACGLRRKVGLALGRTRALAVIMAVLASILVACGGDSDRASDGTAEKLPSIPSGSPVEMDDDQAPNFMFTLFQGQNELGAGPLNLDALRGKPLVINFWAGLCPPCRAELPDLQEFYNEFDDRVTLVGVDLGQFTGLGSLQDAKDLLEELNITYPIASTSDSGVIQDYRVLGLPSTIFIDSEGRIFKNWGGALNLKILQDQTNQMLSQ